VISEGSRHYDRVSKLEWYRNYHVREYWVVDPYRIDDVVRSAVLPDFEEAAAGFFTAAP